MSYIVTTAKIQLFFQKEQLSRVSFGFSSILRPYSVFQNMEAIMRSD